MKLNQQTVEGRETSSDEFSRALQARGLTQGQANRCSLIFWLDSRTDTEQLLIEACWRLIECPVDAEPR